MVVSPIVTATVSPTRTSRAGLTRIPSTWTRPPCTAAVASERVLKKRDAQSHLSMRTRPSSIAGSSHGPAGAGPGVARARPDESGVGRVLHRVGRPPGRAAEREGGQGGAGGEAV